MRIPLDYYRILGLPLAASEEQLRQAYSDRMVQLPRREYSQAAINSRKQLIEEAYVVLSDPKERKAYDQIYLAHAYGSESDRNAAVAVENRAFNSNGNLDSQNLSIEINPEEFVGALLLLQELGEYELVLKLGHPYLVNKNGTFLRVGSTSETDEFGEVTTERADIVLTIALACLEVGREQWQQGHYENAAVSLETGDELLAREGLFSNVRAEIQSDLYRLRPYRILELVALPKEKGAERSQGLQLLQEILDERGGVDGTGDDRSGLSVDDFLRFIQQLRNYLTVAEQHKLFEAESKRPSAVATYLAIYALVARGFTQRQPALIRQAKQMLVRLGKRQDVHLEQSLCALLLGQTEEATRALELSQEYEALAFIREHSLNSPDLLPGLCLYSENWLQNEVFPHFCDLVQERASLKDYFADRRVQAYLEQLPTDAQTNGEEIGINPPSVSQPQAPRQNYRSNPNVVHRRFPQDGRTEPRVPQTPYNRPSYSQYSSSQFSASSTDAGSEGTNLEMPVLPSENSDRNLRGANYYVNGAEPSVAYRRSQPPVKRRRSPYASPGGRTSDQRPITGRRRRYFAVSAKAKTRLMWMVLIGVTGIVVLWLLISTALGWLHNLLSPAPTLQGEQLVLQLNEPILPIPDRNSKTIFPEGPLTEVTAREVIQSWLSTKAAALGPNHEIDSLKEILVGSALSQWQQVAQQEQAENRYRKYEHRLKVESLETSPTDKNYAAVQASVTEAAQFYENGQINQRKSYNETVRVRYSLVRQGNGWRIREMSVINKVSTIL
ncbi:IMS domain-containing protein [Chlorogloeopsis sp. ULAP01]|uniref:IMS domain-containing protein n=1 Tax=Chlorogloeopsis sp. ULAP01 TaxID=3056483 RepID=UPI0025AA74A9|nr:IMS domain-containing protein [Chlorogloeopsis sp. ULAP01]MDM9379477.1 IMS domain-containing protein [Chlorogloeopsis sp. ULAP01]